MTVKIILEVGINHDGSLTKAKKMIDLASEAGADFVKFQTYKADDLLVKSTPKALYQRRNTKSKKSQYEILKNLELNEKDHIELIKHCKKRKIDFLSSPFSIESFNLLKKLKLRIIKIPSGELNNLPYLKHIGKFKKKIILSTGMSYLKEIQRALNILIKAGTPKKNITILHCNSDYPSPFEDINLNAMITIQKKLGTKVGYSDHSLGITVPIAATALGASIIEKHFTLNKNYYGFDHKASLSPDEVFNMIAKIRETEKLLGSYKKKPTYGEIKNKRIARKSIVAKSIIKKGEKFTEKNLTTKRPAHGISPMKWEKIIGKKSKKNYKKDDII